MERVYLDLVSSIRENCEAESLQLASNLSLLGLYLYEQGEAEAESMLLEAIQIYQRKHTQYSSSTETYAYCTLGTIYESQNRLSEAESILKQAAEKHLKYSNIHKENIGLIYRGLAFDNRQIVCYLKAIVQLFYKALCALSKWVVLA